MYTHRQLGYLMWSSTRGKDRERHRHYIKLGFPSWKQYSFTYICHKRTVPDIWLYYWVCPSEPKNTWPVYPKRTDHCRKWISRSSDHLAFFKTVLKEKWLERWWVGFHCLDCSLVSFILSGKDGDVKRESQSGTWQGPFPLLYLLFDKWH